MRSSGLCALILAAVWTTLFAALGADKPVTLAAVPEAARKTMLATAAGAKIISIELAEEDGDLSYDVQIHDGKTTRWLSVAPAGKLLCRQVSSSEMTSSARSIFDTQQGTCGLGEIYETYEEGLVYYDIELLQNGRTNSLYIDQKGTWFSREIELKEVPEKARQVIKEHLGDGTMEDLERTTEGRQVYFEAEITRNSKYVKVNVGAGGKVLSLSEQIKFAELPPPVQKAVSNLPAGGRMKEVLKTIEEGTVYYDINILQDGRTSELRFSPAGARVPKS